MWSQVNALTSDSLFRKFWCEQRTFTVTAYYSPVAGQVFYNKDNYQQEIILNWNWTHWASWKPVFNWMLAAPVWYDFWTKIYFPWFGRWEVADRWWAIVKAWERSWKHDRIDIWMWVWEKWLIKALTWWVKDVKTWVCPKNVDISKITFNQQIWFDLSQIPYFKNFFLMAIFLKSLEYWQNSVWVRELQRQLIKLWYMKPWRDTWYFWEETKAWICKFQIDYWVLNSWSPWCWYYWPRTRTVLKKVLQQRWLLPVNFREKTTFDYLHNYALWKLLKTSNQTKLLDFYKKDNWQKNTRSDIFSNLLLDKKFYRVFHKWEKSEDILILQHKLTMLWYPVSPTWYYWNRTISALKRFQKAHGLIPSWFLDRKTRNLLNKINTVELIKNE